MAPPQQSVIDVEYILGETDTKKQSEQLESEKESFAAAALFVGGRWLNPVQKPRTEAVAEAKRGEH